MVSWENTIIFLNFPLTLNMMWYNIITLDNFMIVFNHGKSNWFTFLLLFL